MSLDQLVSIVHMVHHLCLLSLYTHAQINIDTTVGVSASRHNGNIEILRYIDAHRTTLLYTVQTKSYHKL